MSRLRITAAAIALWTTLPTSSVSGSGNQCVGEWEAQAAIPFDDSWLDTSLSFESVGPATRVSWHAQGETPELSQAPADAAPVIQADDDPWHWSVAPFMWAMQLDGDLVVEGLPAHVDYSFEDLLDHLDFAGMLEVEARRGPWAVQFAGVYAKLSADSSVSLQGDVTAQIDFFRREFDLDIPVEFDADFSMDMKLGVAQLYLSYAVIDHALDGASSATGPRFTLTPYGGVRYTYFSSKVSIQLKEDVGSISANQSLQFEQSEDWFDPVIGLDIGFVNVGNWTFVASADIGGFGLSGSSDLVWSVGGHVSYALNPNIQIVLGYHLLDYDYQTGSGRDAFALDAQFRGPVFGIGIEF